MIYIFWQVWLNFSWKLMNNFSFKSSYLLPENIHPIQWMVNGTLFLMRNMITFFISQWSPVIFFLNIFIQGIVKYDSFLLKQIRDMFPMNGGGGGYVARYWWWTKCFTPIQYIETWAFMVLTSFCKLLYFAYVQVHLVQKQLHWRNKYGVDEKEWLWSSILPPFTICI